MKYILAVDLETTGLKPGYHEVTEIAVILLNLKLRQIDKWQSYVRIEHPERGYENKIYLKHEDREVDVFEYTGIDPKMLELEPVARDVVSDLLLFLDESTQEELKRGDVTLLGQNTKFDDLFLRHLFGEVGQPYIFDYHVLSLDSLYVAYHFAQHSYVPENISLHHMCEVLGYKNPKEHSAKDDIETTVVLARKMLHLLYV